MWEGFALWCLEAAFSLELAMALLGVSTVGGVVSVLNVLLSLSGCFVL
jgi:hypothetical protein